MPTQHTYHLSDLDDILQRKTKFPDDMGFYPVRRAHKQDLKTTWLEDYWNFRIFHSHADKKQKLDCLKELGADSSCLTDHLRGALMGLMLGDTLGMPLEFSKRDELVLTDLISGGPFNLKKGYWTDDTSMAFCTAYSLIKCGGFDARHLMRCFSYWYLYGAYSSTEFCFDIGNTTRKAIEKFLSDENPFAGSTDEFSAGNGSLMRLVPIAMFYANDFEKTVHYAAESSKLTHQSIEAIDSCRFFSCLLFGAINGEKKETILSPGYAPKKGYWEKYPLTEKVQNISNGSYKNKDRSEISSSGYVIHTLEAALWAFYRNDNFHDGVLEAVNLAGDSDTVGAVYGQLAGAYYGETDLPIDWIISTYKCQAPYHFVEDMRQKMNNLSP